MRGSTIKVVNSDFATHQVDVYQDDGTTIIAALGSGGDYFALELMNDGLASASSSWQVIGATHKP